MTMDSLNRCVVGLKLPAPLVSNVEAAQLDVRRRGGANELRFTSAAEVALVLFNLGEIPPDVVRRAQTVVEAICLRHLPFQLAIRGLGGSPNMVQPKSVWLGIEGDVAALGALQTEIEFNLMGLGNPTARVPFAPHIEIGRMKNLNEAARVAVGRAVKMAGSPEIGVLEVNYLELLLATASHQGPGLSVVSVARLGG
ncbi:MAG: hypothetical protein MUC92_02705 [Fimbriimonadaceae bacterium]|jgi:2'-5' RNA ligase|nr:hypothetical protein [Fimbriimonadaceae bacterium]